MSKIDELRKVRDDAIFELRQLEAEEQIKEAAKYIGKCYRYENSYSCPKGPEDYWPLYSRVDGVTEEGNLCVFRFEIDCNGKFEAEARADYSPFMRGYTEIPAQELADAWLDAMERIGNAFAKRTHD